MMVISPQAPPFDMCTAPTEHVIHLHGEHVHAMRWPAPDDARAPFVLLHDSLGSVAQWKDFPAALARASGRGVIAYDRPGYGRSSARDELLDERVLDEEAATTFPALLAAFDMTRCIPLGHSIGGPMAMTVAAALGERCVAAISLSGQAFVEARTLQGVRRTHAAFDDPAQFARLARYHGERTRWVLDAWPAVWFAPGFQGWTLDTVMPRVTCPVLVIHGDHDEYGSLAFPRRMAKHAGGPADMLLLDDCGHFPHRSHADTVISRIVHFLDIHDAAP